MQVLGVQLDIAWEDTAANHDRVRQLLSQVKPASGSLIVLPEMFATGFSMNVAGITDRGETGDFLKGLAQEYRAWVLGGIVSGGAAGLGRNEALLVNPEGKETARYQKAHPFRYAGETNYFEAGEKVVVTDCGEFRVAPIVCYDLRFPELFRAGVRQGANLFAVIANWPAARVEHWVTLLKARAIENQAYVIGVNRCGNDPKLAYPGRTLVIGPRGDVLADGGSGEGVVQAELDLAGLQQYRKEYPFLDDMRL